jgi:hypothetical protein
MRLTWFSQMDVDIDQSRGDYLVSSINRFVLTGRRHCCNAAVDNLKLAEFVSVGHRIDDPTVLNYQVH